MASNTNISKTTGDKIKVFNRRIILFSIKNLHLLVDILHTALPSGNTCQMCNKSLPKINCATKRFVGNHQQRRTDRITNGEIVLYLDIRMET